MALTKVASGVIEANAVQASHLDAGKHGGKYALYRDEKTSGTAGGGFTSGAWQTRTLNTEVVDEIGISLASNELTAPAGTYYVRARAPAALCARHQARLYNVTDASAILVGSSANASAADNDQSYSFVEGRFTLAAQKVIRLEHQCGATRATDGFGVAASFGTEVYAVVELWKVD